MYAEKLITLLIYFFLHTQDIYISALHLPSDLNIFPTVHLSEQLTFWQHHFVFLSIYLLHYYSTVLAQQYPVSQRLTLTVPGSPSLSATNIGKRLFQSITRPRIHEQQLHHFFLLPYV